MARNWTLRTALCVAALVAGPAAWPGVASAAPTAAGPADSLGSICQSVVGIPPGDAQYQACVYALSHYLDRLGEENALAAARKTCMDVGKAPDSPSLSECELSHTERMAPAATIAETPASAPKIGSYFYASPQEVRRREERACARLGLDPTDNVFGRCVARLSAELLEVNNPQQ
ncbi:MAG TPA: hypothetical protein VHY34_12020 [Caulobacteraceae bacterium]|jgi:hypothetical protein|nr:hypothetical protein [Caulobacteraceae bacterium]